jgi:hypothetical protein
MRKTRGPDAIPIGMCLPCCSPRKALGQLRAGTPLIKLTQNEAIQPGQWVRFTHWPLSPDNPPRQVNHLTARNCAVLEPHPGWRTYARTMDLVEVTPQELKDYLASGGTVLGRLVTEDTPDVDPAA